MKHYSLMNRIVSFMAALLLSSVASAASLNVADEPLFVSSSGADPNVLMVLDDSGSMQWDFMPEYFGAYMSFPSAITIYGYYYSSYNTVLDLDKRNIYGVRHRSPDRNKMYYNPAVTYGPWIKHDGSLYAPADPKCAPHNPYEPWRGCRNLTTQNKSSNRHSSTAAYAYWYDRNRRGRWKTYSFWPATYFRHKGGSTTNWRNYQRIEIKKGNAPFDTDGKNLSGQALTDRSERTDCASLCSHITEAACNSDSACHWADGQCPYKATTCSYNEEIQNYANWYTYFRSRILTSRSGIGHAFDSLDENYRVGYSEINQSGGPILQVGTFEGHQRQRFYDLLYQRPIGGGTPLRRSLDDAGRYYQRKDDGGPWGPKHKFAPGDERQLTCRQSYTVMMTDGEWSSGSSYDANTAGARKNVDNKNGPRITQGGDYQYKPAFPYKDNYSDTLADVAMYYWNRDLRTDLANDVSPNDEDEAFWQHMVTYTVGLGVDGYFKNPDDYNDLASGKKRWYNPNWYSKAKIDDLWHAAINGRGIYLSAHDPKEFADSFTEVLSNIESRSASSSALAVSSGRIDSESQSFQAIFSSDDWSAELVAKPISDGNGNSTCTNESIGELCPEVWDASEELQKKAWDAREILTFNPSSNKGVPFQWGSINADQQAALQDGGSLVEGIYRWAYVRGDQSEEKQNGGIMQFRDRDNLLGDIVSSNPLHVSPPDRFYPDDWDDKTTSSNDRTPEDSASESYGSFKNRLEGRSSMVYVGANDGMIHGFEAGKRSSSGSFVGGTNKGKEKFAYIPSTAYEHLASLSDAAYTHKFFADGSPSENDVFYGGRWHSVLATGLGAGGQAVIAMDITEPDKITEGKASNTILWEFTDKKDKDLGYTFSRPQIVRMHNGRWAAVFGNGFDNTESDGRVSSTGNAVLYVVDIETGKILKKFDTKVGKSKDPQGKNRPNGLGSVSAIDVDADLIVDYLYSADLFGNVWKFDVTSTSSSSWKVGFGTNSAPKPFFTAKDSSGDRLAITTKPVVGLHPNGPSHGVMVYFGAGKFFEVGDNTPNLNFENGFYGVWDSEVISFTANYKPSVTHGASRSKLQVQQITQERSASGNDYRITTDNEIDWASKSNTGGKVGWYLDFKEKGQAYTGEMMISDPTLRGGRIIFATREDSTDPCSLGAESWLYVLDFRNGGRTSSSPFDVDGNGAFDKDDLFSVSGEDTAASAQKIDGGANAPTFILGGGSDIALISKNDGTVVTAPIQLGIGADGRRSWRVLR